MKHLKNYLLLVLVALLTVSCHEEENLVKKTNDYPITEIQLPPIPSGNVFNSNKDSKDGRLLKQTYYYEDWKSDGFLEHKTGIEYLGLDEYFSTLENDILNGNAFPWYYDDARTLGSGSDNELQLYGSGIDGDAWAAMWFLYDGGVSNMSFKARGLADENTVTLFVFYDNDWHEANSYVVSDQFVDIFVTLSINKPIAIGFRTTSTSIIIDDLHIKAY